MWIKSVKISNFRNYDLEKIDFDKNINLLYGKNAQGKTNIIEAIFLCTIGKSFRTSKEKEMIKIDSSNSFVEMEYSKKDRDGKIRIELSNKKSVYINGIKIKKLSDLLGKLNAVIFNPDDINILKGGPQNRRKFMDIMISQLRPNYMHILSLYLKTVEQRNNYLRQIREQSADSSMLDIWDEKLCEYAIQINNYRKEYIDKIQDKIQEVHSQITSDKELINIEYISDCFEKESYLKLLKERRKLDIIKGFTTKGIHRDDFVIYINEKQVNIYGSQGQHRTVILSLKLSELNIVRDEIGESPILLLDDFMSELDSTRRQNFLEKIENAQVIITCTDKLDIENKDILIYNVKDGKVDRH